MSNMTNRILGDTPTRVLIKLVILSFIAGLIMSTIGWSPRDIYEGLIRFFSRIWELGFDTILNSVEYMILGAAIVVPIFILVRILSFRSR